MLLVRRNNVNIRYVVSSTGVDVEEFTGSWRQGLEGADLFLLE